MAGVVKSFSFTIALSAKLIVVKAAEATEVATATAVGLLREVVGVNSHFTATNSS